MPGASSRPSGRKGRMERVTAVVPTFNEEAKIEDCLRSARFADELVVVDCNSGDRTREIASEIADRVELHTFTGFAELKNRCLREARHRWVLLLDADERVSPGLRDEMTAVLSRPARPGYWIPRVNHFLGKRIRGAGWGGEKVLRLVDRDRGRYPERLVHERLRLDGEAGALRGKLLHYPYESLEEYWTKFHRYAWLSAGELKKQGRGGGLFALLLRPPARFLRMYLLQMGFIDGTHGFLLCGLSALQVYTKYARLWELNREDEGRAHRLGEDVERRRGAGSGPGRRP